MDEPAQPPLPHAAGLRGRDDCEVGRLRLDCALDNGLAFWVSGDQLAQGRGAQHRPDRRTALTARLLLAFPAAADSLPTKFQTYPTGWQLFPPPPRRPAQVGFDLKKYLARPAAAGRARAADTPCRRRAGSPRRSTRPCATACSPAARNGCGPSCVSRRRRPAAATARKRCRSPARWSASTRIR